MSAPSMKIEPDVGASNPAISRSMVVLPQPDGPRSVRNSPGAIERSTLLTPIVPPSNLLVTLFSWTTGLGSIHHLGRFRRIDPSTSHGLDRDCGRREAAYF